MSSSFVVSGEKSMKSRTVKYIGTPGLLLWLASPLALGRTTLCIPDLPGTLKRCGILAKFSFRPNSAVCEKLLRTIESMQKI
jgi:hypothetical protein